MMGQEKIYSIENNTIKIAVSTTGAELQSIESKPAAHQYMWDANPAFWSKYSPILFPIVGALKDGTYNYQEKQYHLPRHGFAREKIFRVVEETRNSLSFLLESSEDTLKVYPFAFQLYVNYTLGSNSLSVAYRVVNMGNTDMYFSVGGHPAFKVPIFDGDIYSDYILKFNKIENAGRWLLDGGLIDTGTQSFLDNSDTVQLEKSLFYEDAVVLKNLKSTQVQLVSSKSGKGFSFDFSGFPYLGIWAAPNADFVCIEPWCGIADSTNTNQQLAEKEGIVRLQCGKMFERNWTFAFLDGSEHVG